MYLRGLNGMGEVSDEVATQEYGLSNAPSGGIVTVPAASNTGPTDNVDWTRLVSTALTTWGNVTVARTNANANVAMANRYPGYPVASYYNPLTGSYTTVPAAQPSAISGGMLLLIAAAAAAFFLLKD